MIGVELRVGGKLAAFRPLAQHGRAKRAAGASESGEAAFDQRGVAFVHPSRRAEHDRAERDEVLERAPRRIARRPHQVHEVRHLMRRQQLDPFAELADLIIRLAGLRKENDAGRVEQRVGEAVRLRDRIDDDDVGPCLGGVSGLLGDGAADRFELRRRAQRPRLVIARIVNAEVRRLDASPVVGGRLRDRA